jgi:uncharacterized protein YvpB
MVDKTELRHRGPAQRDMLTHRGSTVRSTASLARTDASQVSGSLLTSSSALLTLLLCIGLTSIGGGLWFGLSRGFAKDRDTSAAVPPPNATAGGSRRELSSQLASAESTRDAQYAEIVRLRTESDQLHRALATADARFDALQEGSPFLDQPPLALILDVPVYRQQHSLSCESSAAAMAANYHGIAVTEEDILSVLPRHENPHLGFRGDVDGPYGGIADYGVYAEPIGKALTDLGLQVEPIRSGPDEIRMYIRQGRPVIAWITFGLQPQVPTQVSLSDGQVVTLVPYQHTVLVVGYNRDGLWVNDPYGGTQDFYPEGEFVRSFAYLGNMGLAVGSPAGR